MKKSIEINYGKFNNIELSVFTNNICELIPAVFKVSKLVFHLVSDDELLEINKTHLNHDYYTDIITFDYTQDNWLKGEVYISVDRVKDNSNGKKFREEILRVLCHGVLHMVGFNDKNKDEKRIMRAMEDEWIYKLVSRES